MSLFVEYIRQFARFQRNARLYLICSALSSVTTGIILVLYNLYLGALGYGADFIGLALFVVALGAGLMIFPAGLCVDRSERQVHSDLGQRLPWHRRRGPVPVSPTRSLAGQRFPGGCGRCISTCFERPISDAL